MRRVLPLIVVLATVAHASTAVAAWTAGGNGSAAAKAYAMPAGSQPSASVANRDVTVSWPASVLGGSNVAGYTVRRYDSTGVAQTVGAGCSGTITGLSCTESAVAPGSWRYTVTPVQAGWRGAESPQSTAVTVAPPSLTFSGSVTLTSLPAALTGSLAHFIPGETVTMRLDDPTTGLALAVSVSPTLVGTDGTAMVLVTVPLGITGSHWIFAYGSQGDVASAAINVVGSPTTITTPAWSVSDQSGGTAQVTDASDAFASTGGPSASQSGFTTSADAQHYVAFDFVSALTAGSGTPPARGVNFNLTYHGTDSAGRTAANTCFYFDVRRASTGALIATHGSATAPVDCVAALTWKTVSTPLPEIDTTDKANDLEIRVYASNAAGTTGVVDEDQATITGSQGATADPFTLYRTRLVANQVTAVSPTAGAWSLAGAGDGAALTTANRWGTSFSTSQFIKLTFPAYVPSGATGVSATFKHSYRSTSSGTQTCWYFEVYQGTTLLATHGSSAAPVSCNSGTTFVTDTVSLPEVNSAARANNVVIRIYASNNGTANQRKTDHDLAALSVTYS
jgi:hypothetical protein